MLLCDVWKLLLHVHSLPNLLRRFTYVSQLYIHAWNSSSYCASSLTYYDVVKLMTLLTWNGNPSSPDTFKIWLDQCYTIFPYVCTRVCIGNVSSYRTGTTVIVSATLRIAGAEKLPDLSEGLEWSRYRISVCWRTIQALTKKSLLCLRKSQTRLGVKSLSIGWCWGGKEAWLLLTS